MDRTEKDFLGEKKIPKDALYGIHSLRAKENFPDNSPFSLEWYKAVGLTKLACYLTYDKFKNASTQKYSDIDLPINLFEKKIIDALIESAEEVSEGKYYDHFIVPAIQGGAGTSINMNVNEIIANVSLKKLGKNAGNYQTIDPIEHANIYQSTNDVIPTSLKVAAIKLLVDLEEKINELRTDIEALENKNRNKLRIGYTQMQEAVPSSFGMLFSSYNEALSRDWWRVSKCFERIKIVNLGGSAIGTGIAVPRFFIMEAVATLQKLTNLPITRSENMPDATSNLDSLVEVHAILKAHAVNLEKMASDIRLLSSDL
ncbi:MAG: lyase family protein, partial [Bacteroidales bacterium]